VLLLKYSYAFLVLPGGVGTLDELFETRTLIHTGKISHFPVVLMGESYWTPLINQLDRMKNEGAIVDGDMDHLLITDDVDKVMHFIRKHSIDEYGLTRRLPPKPIRLFGERNW